MSLTLYAGSGSPFVWKVWLALEFKGLEYTLKMLSFSAGETRTPEFRAVNPRGKVPALEHDGRTLWESGPILEYLEDAFPEPRLWPEDPFERALARRLTAEHDLYLYPALRRALAQSLFRGDKPGDPAELEAGLAETQIELERFAAQLRGPYLCGALTGADLALFPSLALIRRLDLRAPELGAGRRVPAALVEYTDRMTALPLVQRTWPPHWKA
jgi:glutathione S-transferase